MLPKPTEYVISNNNQSIMINTTIFVKPEPRVEPELTLEQLIENAFKPKTSMSFVMMLSIFLVILTFIAFMLYCCKHRIMQCLKRAGFKEPNPNKPSQLFEKHQAEVKKQCDNIGKNVHQIQSDITTMFRAIPKIQDTPVIPAVWKYGVAFCHESNSGEVHHLVLYQGSFDDTICNHKLHTFGLFRN